MRGLNNHLTHQWIVTLKWGYETKVVFIQANNPKMAMKRAEKNNNTPGHWKAINCKRVR